MSDRMVDLLRDRIQLGPLWAYAHAATRSGPWTIGAAHKVEIGSVLKYQGVAYRVTGVERRGALIQLTGEVIGG